MGVIVGFDIGTSNSNVAVCDGSKAWIVLPDGEQKTMPSVFFADGSTELVGSPAVAAGRADVGGLYMHAKRHIGVEWDPNRMGRITRSDDGLTWLDGSAGPMAPEYIHASYIARLRDAVERETDEEVTHAVICVPAGFNNNQRLKTREAAMGAGIANVTMFEEPSAAAICYGMTVATKFTRPIVYDWGGGTFDCAYMQCGKSGPKVLAKDGDPDLGGYDVDIEIARELERLWVKNGGADIYPDPLAWERLLIAAEVAKIELSSRASTPVFLQDIQPGKHLSYTLTDKDMARIAKPMIDRTLRIMLDLMKRHGITSKDVDDVILVGGMTLMPAVRAALEAAIGKAPRANPDPKEIVALGAAWKGAIDAGLVKMKVQDIAPHTLAIETIGSTGRVPTRLINRGERLSDKGLKVPVQISTEADNQSIISVHLLQGEGLTVKDRSIVGRHHFNVQPLPKGEAVIEVEAGYDAFGEVQLSYLRETRQGV